MVCYKNTRAGIQISVGESNWKIIQVICCIWPPHNFIYWQFYGPGDKHVHWNNCRIRTPRQLSGRVFHLDEIYPVINREVEEGGGRMAEKVFCNVWNHLMQCWRSDCLCLPISSTLPHPAHLFCRNKGRTPDLLWDFNLRAAVPSPEDTGSGMGIRYDVACIALNPGIPPINPGSHSSVLQDLKQFVAILCQAITFWLKLHGLLRWKEILRTG